MLLDTETAVPDEVPPNKLFVTWPTTPPEPRRLFMAVVPLVAVFVTDPTVGSPLVAPLKPATVPPLLFTPEKLTELTVFASRNSCNDFPGIIRMIEDGRIDTAPWITIRMGLADVPSQFPLLRQQPNLVKAMIEVRDTDT